MQTRRAANGLRAPSAERVVRPRPGGRTERIRRAVAQAVLDLLREGHVEFGVAEVAARSGVHRSTVYRRWPARSDLIAEALTLHNSELRIPDTGDWEEDIRALTRELALFFAEPVELALNSAMASARDPELNDAMVRHWLPLMEEMEGITTRAIGRGDVPPETEPRLIIDLIVGPLMTHTLLMREQPDGVYLERLASAVLRSTPRRGAEAGISRGARAPGR